MQPSAEEFNEWRQHPVTEWIFACVAKFGVSQKELWAAKAWDDEDIDPLLLREAKARADCYAALSESSFEDWLAIDDTGTEYL